MEVRCVYRCRAKFILTLSLSKGSCYSCNQFAVAPLSFSQAISFSDSGRGLRVARSI